MRRSQGGFVGEGLSKEAWNAPRELLTKQLNQPAGRSRPHDSSKAQPPSSPYIVVRHCTERRFDLTPTPSLLCALPPPQERRCRAPKVGGRYRDRPYRSCAWTGRGLLPRQLAFWLAASFARVDIELVDVRFAHYLLILRAECSRATECLQGRAEHQPLSITFLAKARCAHSPK